MKAAKRRVVELTDDLHSQERMCDHLNREMTELSRERLELSTSYEERCIELAASEASCASVS